jgi:hypothetical protein
VRGAVSDDRSYRDFHEAAAPVNPKVADDLVLLKDRISPSPPSKLPAGIAAAVKAARFRAP